MCLFPTFGFSQSCGAAAQVCIRWIHPSSISTCVGWKKGGFDKLIQFIQVDIGEEWTQNTALWAPTRRFMILPLFQVSCLEKGFDETKESPIMDLFSQDGKHDLMVKRIKTLRNISFYKPFCSYPRMVNLV